MLDHDGSLTKYLYIFMAALAGAITSLSFMNWRTMERSEIIMTIFVGFAFAVITVPWLTIDVLKLSNADSLRVGCALTYFGATAANAVIPIFIKRVKVWAEKFSAEEEKMP